eukprot:scaffold157580_cov36-Tisochrysis_lutea.AAC.4
MELGSEGGTGLAKSPGMEVSRRTRSPVATHGLVHINACNNTGEISSLEGWERTYDIRESIVSADDGAKKRPDRTIAQHP